MQHLCVCVCVHISVYFEMFDDECMEFIRTWYLICLHACEFIYFMGHVR